MHMTHDQNGRGKKDKTTNTETDGRILSFLILYFDKEESIIIFIFPLNEEI